jgi:hypothetical protein
MANLMTRLPLAAFTPGYEAGASAAPNSMAGRAMLSQEEALARQRGVIDRLRERGVFQD